MSNTPMMDESLAAKDSKYRDAGKARVSIDRRGICGLGRGSDGHPLVALTLRKDGLRLRANIQQLAKNKRPLGRAVTGKSCLTLKRAAGIEDTLIWKIVKGSLAAKAVCER